MIFISDYSLRSKDILLLTTFSYREAGGTHAYVSPPPHKKNKKKFRKKFYIRIYLKPKNTDSSALSIVYLKYSNKYS